jgi:hypothetical protein
MAKSTKMGPQKPKLLGNPEARKDKKNKIAKETRAFNKEKLEKEDAQRNATVRVAKRPEKKVK